MPEENFSLCVEPGLNIDTIIYPFLKFPFGVILPFTLAIFLYSQTDFGYWHYLAIFPAIYLTTILFNLLRSLSLSSTKVDWKKTIVVITGGKS